MEQDPSFFERLVMDVLTAIGYGRGEQLGGTGDEGFDGVIRRGSARPGPHLRASEEMGEPRRPPAVQGFVGALAGRGASKGVFITTSAFTAEAKTYVNMVQARVVLIDGPELARLMIDYGVGVSVASRYDVKRVDLDYFTEDGSLTPVSAPADTG